MPQSASLAISMEEDEMGAWGEALLRKRRS